MPWLRPAAAFTTSIRPPPICRPPANRSPASLTVCTGGDVLVTGVRRAGGPQQRRLPGRAGVRGGGHRWAAPACRWQPQLCPRANRQRHGHERSDRGRLRYSRVPPTSSQIASAVWQDTAAGDFTVSGSVGKSLFTDRRGTAGGLPVLDANGWNDVNVTRWAGAAAHHTGLQTSAGVYVADTLAVSVSGNTVYAALARDPAGNQLATATAAGTAASDVKAILGVYGEHLRRRPSGQRHRQRGRQRRQRDRKRRRIGGERYGRGDVGGEPARHRGQRHRDQRDQRRHARRQPARHCR